MGRKVKTAKRAASRAWAAKSSPKYRKRAKSSELVLHEKRFNHHDLGTVGQRDVFEPTDLVRLNCTAVEVQRSNTAKAGTPWGSNAPLRQALNSTPSIQAKLRRPRTPEEDSKV